MARNKKEKTTSSATPTRYKPKVAINTHPRFGERKSIYGDSQNAAAGMKYGSFKTESATTPRYRPRVAINTHPRYGERKQRNSR